MMSSPLMIIAMRLHPATYVNMFGRFASKPVDLGRAGRSPGLGGGARAVARAGLMSLLRVGNLPRPGTAAAGAPKLDS